MIKVNNVIDFRDYIDEFLNKKECDDIEFKSAAGGFPGSFWETYSAFANTDGGTIVLGVVEKNDSFYIDGLSKELIEKYRKEFWNNVNNRSTISHNLLKSDDVLVGDYEGHNILLFYIPRAAREQRPVFRTANPYNGTFKRNYEGDYKCTDDEVRRMYADANVNCPADSRILKNYTMEDIDGETFAQYRQLFKISSPDHPWHILGDLELLKKLGGYRKDRQTNEEGFTLAGLLMFGKTQSIQDVECAPNFFPDYQEHLSEDKNIRWTNRICADGTWEANLFNFYQRVLPRLQSVLPKPFVLEGGIRKVDTPAHVAVREALVNLCVHADYTVNASLVVRHELNRFVFSNPGTMLVSKNQYYQGGESVCRNKALQTMFSMIGAAEKAGSGTDKILQGWKETNWRSPNIEETSAPDKVVLVMPMETLLSEKAKKILGDQYGISANAFSRDVMQVLALVCDEGYVTNQRLRYSLSMHKGEISELLKKMCHNGLLKPEGHGRGMRYVLGDKESCLLYTNSATSDANSATSDANSATSGVNSATSDANSATSGVNSATSDANSATSEANSVTSDDTRRKRMNKEELSQQMRIICCDWVSLEEIVSKIGLSYSYVRNTVIPKMMEALVIERMYPGTPNHPKQKYKIKD
ncbi:MAG: putative DNA binding domain-containing protein [Prevotellaceae bacterium]|nr:putative DNA binding domain-containing protein [Candidatus Faecinaster equi]